MRRQSLRHRVRAAGLWVRRQRRGLVLLALVVGIFTLLTAARAAISHVASIGAGDAGFLGLGTSSITVNKPAGTASGDFMVAAVANRLNNPMSAPAGWTQRITSSGAQPPGLTIFTKFATASEPSSYTFTQTSGLTNVLAGTISSFRGVDTTTPIDVIAAQANATSSSATAPSLTTTVANTVLVSIFGSSGTTASTPTGQTLAATASAANLLYGTNLTTAYQSVSSAGATGTRVANLSFSDASNGISIALRPAITYTVSGTVYEDINYGGGAGRSKVMSSGGSVRPNVQVELYSVSGTTATFANSTTTDASGNYSFTTFGSGTYAVRVVSSTVTSGRTGAVSSLLPVQTFRTDASSGTPVAVTDQVGGLNPAASDAGAGATGSAFNTGTGVFSSGPSGTAQSFAIVTFNTTTVAGVDFGFNFNTVSNTNNSGAGSLRQVITNANQLGGEASLAQSGRTAGTENVVFMISNGTAAAGLRSTNNYLTTLAGSTYVATIAPTSALPTISASLVVDAQTQPGWSSAPILELNGTGAGASSSGLTINAASTVIRGLVVNRFPQHGIAVTGGTGSTIEACYVGTNAVGAAAAANGSQGIQVSGGSVTIGGLSQAQRNVISGNTLNGVNVNAGTATIQGNYIGANASNSGAIANGNSGVYLGASNSTVGGTATGAGNVIRGNNATARGVAVGNSSCACTGNAILGNSIYGNGSPGIDLMANGVTANDGLKSAGLTNLLMDTPVFTSVSLSGTTLDVAGYVGSAPNQSTFASARVEIFVSDQSSSAGQGQTYLGTLTTDANGNFSGSLTGISGITVGSTRLTATATDGSGNTSEFGPNAVVGYSINGTVFEDVNYGGGAGRSQAAASGVGLAGATVELYSGTGVWTASTTTASDGSYRFGSLAAGSYHVRVVNSSVASQRVGTVGTLRGVMTYRTNGSSGSAVPVTDFVGGTNPALVDPGAGSTGATFNTTSFVYSAVLSGTAQSVAPVTISSAGVTGVDFGFNFNTVTNLNDSGQGSLRQVITNANTLTDDASLAQSGLTAGTEHAIFMLSNGSTSPGGALTATGGLRSTINLFSGSPATATITLTSGTLTVTGPVRLLGASTSTVISGNNSNRLFTSSSQLQIANLTLMAGFANGLGGCINATGGSLTISNAVLTGCTASNSQGGAIAASATAVALSSVTVQNSSATTGNGGGIYLVGGSLSASSSVFSGNSASNGGGGAVWLGTGTSATITDTSFTNNSAGSTGGGALGSASASTLDLARVTFSGNNGNNGSGGGLYVASGTATATNATFSGNRTNNGGGAIGVAGGSLSLVNVTVASNTVVNGAAGLAISAGTLSLRNTLVANNTGGLGNCSGTITNTANNLDSGATCGFGSLNSSLSNSNPLLSALASNGGSTQTMALGAGSPAINAGTSTSAPANDQRGYYRSGAVDIGAYEYGGSATPGYTVSGTVFEDVNYGGGAGRSQASASGVGLAGATVELYAASGSYVGNTTTASNGRYSFTNVQPGGYLVRVLTSSVRSSRTGSVAGLWPVQTWRYEASMLTPAAVTNEVGGQQPGVADSGAALALTWTGCATESGGSSNPCAFSGTRVVRYGADTRWTARIANDGIACSNAVFGDPASGSPKTCQILVPHLHSASSVQVSSADVSVVDFGFNFDTVTNTNDSGQGSLRQAITNANTLAGDTSLAQSGRTAGIENIVFMIPNGTAAAGLRSAINDFTTAAGAYNVATIRPASTLPAISDSLVLDAQTQPGWSTNPVIELSGVNAGGVAGLRLAGGNSVVRGLIINRFSGTGGDTGSGRPGVGLQISVAGNRVQGCWIGLDASGTTAAPNSNWGIYVASGGGNTIGGTSSTVRNVMSGNGYNGLYIASGNSNTIQGNYVGTNAAGSGAVPNGSVGIYLHAATQYNTVGGAATGQGNVISGNTGEGLVLRGGSGGNVIRGNIIGMNATGTAALPNSAGILLSATGNNNTIGGTGTGQGNVIAGNAGAGIAIAATPASFANEIRGNQIYSNAGLGIDLGSASSAGGDGLTLNDGAKTTGQPNVWMDSPVITSTSLSGTTLTVSGYVGSAPNQSTFGGAVVDVYVADDSGTGGTQGKTWLGTLTADANGNFTGTISGVSGVTAGSTQFTATATDANGNTSEFSSGAAAGFALSGTVFEDVNYGGGAGRSQAAAGGIGLSGATVELYDSAGAFVSSTGTGAGGSYTLRVLGAGTYYLRVVSASVVSQRTGSVNTLLGVLTYRTQATGGSMVAVTDQVGGTNPALADPGAASSGASFNTSTYVYTAGLSGTAQNVTAVNTGSASSVTGLDFGFHFGTVVNTNDAGRGSLRQALINANTLGGDSGLAQTGRTPGIEHLVFMLPNGTSGSGGSASLSGGLRSSFNAFTTSAGSRNVATITPTSTLPTISSPLVIDAQAQPGWTSAPLIELNGASAGAGSHGLTLSGSGVVVRGLVVNRFSASGLSLSGANHAVQGCWIGLNAAGTAASANQTGLTVAGATSTTVGGASASLNNTVSGNSGYGIDVQASSSGTVVLGNRIGLNAAGTGAVGNGNTGLRVGSTGVTVGGTASGAGNVISGNATSAITVLAAASGTLIQGNTLGLAADGTTSIVNPWDGLQIYASNVQVGGTASGAGNVIGGFHANASGIAVFAGANNAVIEGNTIGLNATRTAARPSGHGVWFQAGTTGARVGGSTAAAANVIAGNSTAGVAIWGATTGISIQRNSMWSNGGASIDLSAGPDDGPTPNDGVKTAGGANLLIDTPVITSASLNGSTLVVSGYVGSAANQSTFGNVTVDVYLHDAASSSPSGITWLGSVMTNASGNFSGTITGVSGLTGGVSGLTATATDSSGNTSEFGGALTTSATTASLRAQWDFETITGTTTPDSSGNGNTLSLGASGVSQTTGMAGQALTLNGNAPASGASTGAALTTTGSYTVSAWVKFAGMTSCAAQSVIAQEGVTTHAFEIVLIPNCGLTQPLFFEIMATDADSSATKRVYSSFAPAINTWYHVAGVFDASTGTMSFYVNCSLQGTQSGVTTYNASGPLVVGRSRFSGGYRDPLNGSLDTVKVWSGVRSASELATECADPTHTLQAQYTFEQAGWNGSSGEVLDTSGNGYHGTAASLSTTKPTTANLTPAIAGSSGTCRYGVFNRSNKDHVALPSSLPNLGASSSFTGTAWIRTTDNTQAGQRILIDDENGYQPTGVGWILSLGDRGTGKLNFYTRGTSATDEVITGNVIANNTWYFVAFGVDFASKTKFIRVLDTSGTQLAYVTTTYTQASIGSDAGLMSIGGETNNAAGGENTSSFGFAGLIDDVRIYSGALSAGETSAVWALRSNCAVFFDHVEIQHASGTGLTCSPTTVTVRACQDSACSSLYTGGVSGTLTASGVGMVWPSGAGFSIPAGSSSTSVALQLTTAGSAVLGATNLSLSSSRNASCNFGSPTCSFSAADAGFQFDVPDHRAELANSVTVTAVKKADNSAACVPAFANVTKSVTFRCLYTNPASGTQAVRVGGTALNSSNSASAACDVGGRAVNLAFDATGRATTSVQYADVGQLTLSAVYTGLGSDAGLTMTGSDSFIAAPASFGFSGLPSGTIAAGSAFSVSVSALNSAGAVTPNFGRETAAEGATLSFARRAPTGSGAVDGSFTGTLGSFSSGVANAANLVWSEVGTADLSVELTSGQYLGTPMSASGSTGTGGALGPFTPHHFDVVTSAACGSFTYAGQPFAATLTARNAANAVTLNYDGSSATSPNFARTVTLSDAGALSVGSWSGHVLLPPAFVAGVARASPSYAFSAKLTVPQTLQVRATDSNAISSQGGAEGTVALRSGRLRAFNRFGPDGVPLSIPVQAEYWGGKAWVLNSADNCSLIPASALTRVLYWDRKGAAASPWSGTDTGTALSGGLGSLTIAAPPAGSFGSVDIALNLGTGSADDQSCLASHARSTGANLPWLRSRQGSCATDWATDPAVRATFGVRAPETRKLIDVREIY